MPHVHTILRCTWAGLAIAVLGALTDGRAVAGGHHGHGIASGIAYVPVTSGYQVVTSAAPALTMTLAAPSQLQFVSSVQTQAVSAPLQFVMPSVATPTTNVVSVPAVMFVAPQNLTTVSGTTSSAGLQTGLLAQQPSLTEGNLLFQQQLLQQMEASGWLRSLRDRLTQRLNELRTQNGGVLPGRDLIIKLLVDEALAFLRPTPFGPFLPFLQPAIERLIDTLIREQQPTPAPAPAPAPAPTPAGGVRRFVITVQEVASDGTVPPVGPTVPPVEPPVDQRNTTTSPDSPLEKFAPYPNGR